MDLSEAETRIELIDRRLALAGWHVKDHAQVIEELEIHLRADQTAYPNASYAEGDSRFSDYGLLLNGDPAAVIEAKRTSRDAELGKEQALQYAEQLRAFHDVELPFVFYTNGHEYFFWDSDNYAPEQIAGFPTKDDLEWMHVRRKERKPLSIELVNRDVAGRHESSGGMWSHC